MSAKPAQRQVTVVHFDSDAPRPVCTHLVLRAWFLQHAQMNSWVNRKDARHKWLDQNVANLKREIAKLGGGRSNTGSKRADALIKRWEPEVSAV